MWIFQKDLIQEHLLSERNVDDEKISRIGEYECWGMGFDIFGVDHVGDDHFWSCEYMAHELGFAGDKEY